MIEKKTTKKKEASAPKKKSVRAKKEEPKIAKEHAVSAPQPEAEKPKQIEHKPAEQKTPERKPYVKREPKPKKLPVTEFYHGTGRRKTSIAVVYIHKGTGKITVNSKPYEEYFCKRPVLLATVNRVLKELNVVGAYDIVAEVKGGGVPSQADAIRMGIARALVASNAELRKPLRTLDLLKRDPRMKERKKYGLKRARRAFQYTKR